MSWFLMKLFCLMVFCDRSKTDPVVAILVFLWETFDHLEQLVKAVHIPTVLEALVRRQCSVVLGMDCVVQVQSERAGTQGKCFNLSHFHKQS